MSPVLPLQIANAALVCNLRPGGISISPRSPLEPTRKTPSVFLDFSREICNSSKFLTHQKAPPWAQGADSPYQGEMARRANGGRDAGAKRLRGFGCRKVRNTLIFVTNPLRHFLRKCHLPLPRGAWQGEAVGAAANPYTMQILNTRRKRLGSRRRVRNGLDGTSRRYVRRLLSAEPVSSFPKHKRFAGLCFGGGLDGTSRHYVRRLLSSEPVSSFPKHRRFAGLCFGFQCCSSLS